MEKFIKQHIIKESDFIANWPYQLSIAISNGEIQHCDLYKARPGLYTHWSLKLDNGEWIEHGKPIEFGSLGLISWSHGCIGRGVWLISDNYSGFKSAYTMAIESVFCLYKEQLTKEIEKAKEAMLLIDNLTL